VNTEPAEKFFPLHGASAVHGAIDSLSWLDDVDTWLVWKASLGFEVDVLAAHTLVSSELPNELISSLAVVVVVVVVVVVKRRSEWCQSRLETQAGIRRNVQASVPQSAP
jgi:hypothetical protein